MHWSSRFCAQVGYGVVADKEMNGKPLLVISEAYVVGIVQRREKSQNLRSKSCLL